MKQITSRFSLIMGFAILGLMPGCASQRPAHELWVDARPYEAELRTAMSLQVMPSKKALPTNLKGEISMRDAVALSLMQNPGLKASGFEVKAAEADAMQLGRPPNPQLGLAVENLGGSASDPYFDRQVLRLSQVIELGDKRAKRRALGNATQRLRAWDYEQQRISTAADAAKRYVSVVVAQERVALAEQQLRVVVSGRDLAASRVQAELVPSRELDQATARVALSRIALEQARQRLAADRADLAAAWGSDKAEFERALGELSHSTQRLSLESLKQRLKQSPAVARWDDEVEQRRRAWELAKANAVVDPTVGGGVKFFPDADDAAGLLELGVPLQVFDRNRGAILAARLRIGQARAQKQQAEAEAARLLTSAYSRFESASFALEALSRDALPASDSAYRAALSAYESGLTGYLDVLDAERTLLQVRNHRVDALRDYHHALIEIERITAYSLGRDQIDEEKEADD